MSKLCQQNICIEKYLLSGEIRKVKIDDTPNPVRVLICFK